MKFACDRYPYKAFCASFTTIFIYPVEDTDGFADEQLIIRISGQLPNMQMKGSCMSRAVSGPAISADKFQCCTTHNCFCYAHDCSCLNDIRYQCHSDLHHDPWRLRSCIYFQLPVCSYYTTCK